MTGQTIDARARFGGRSKQQERELKSPEEVEMERMESLRQEVKPLRERLESKERLDPSDRKVLARNLGRAIERETPEHPTKTAGLLFRFVYGEEGGVV
ncbi:hypothetical protein N4R57_15525 [Rhodobacteraceae bacterium D3-12]|nr:hypothetical protein N4R57_15525 [Rhodobacteraceae bacterium D3-12]